MRGGGQVLPGGGFEHHIQEFADQDFLHGFPSVCSMTLGKQLQFLHLSNEEERLSFGYFED